MTSFYQLLSSRNSDSRERVLGEWPLDGMEVQHWAKFEETRLVLCTWGDSGYAIPIARQEPSEVESWKEGR